MKYNFRYFILLLFAAPFVFWGIDSFTQKIYADKVELDFNLKAYNSANLVLFYNEKPNEFLISKAVIKKLNVSQFYTHSTFEVPEISQIKHLRLDLGDDSNQFFIQNLALKLKGPFKDTIIKVWTGKEIKGLIDTLHGTAIASENNFYMQCNATADDPYLLFNNMLAKELDYFYSHSGTHKIAQYIATVVVSLFILALLFFALSYSAAKSVKTSVQNGSTLIYGMILLIGIIFLNNRFHFMDDRQSQEKRTLAQQPELTTGNFFSYPDEYASYARDNFSFRNYLFFMHSVYMAKVFASSPIPDVIMGKDGWFYYNEPGSISDVKHLSAVSEAELFQITKTVREKKKWLDDRHIKFYVIVPPNKGEVYPEYLPGGYFQTTGIGVNRMDVYKMQLALHAGVHVVTPKEALLQAKQKREVYYKTDTHWNLYGGYIGYTELMKDIVKDFPYLQPVKEEEFKISNFLVGDGDLTGMTDLGDLYKRQVIAMDFKDSTKKLNQPLTSDMVLRYKDAPTLNGSNLRLLMMRDSYSNYLIPFLNLHFKNATYVWSYNFPDKMIEEEKPDVVIFESLQCFIGTAFVIPNPESLSDTTNAQSGKK